MIPEGFVETTPEPVVRVWKRGAIEIRKYAEFERYQVCARKTHPKKPDFDLAFTWRVDGELADYVAKAEAWLEDPR